MATMYSLFLGLLFVAVFSLVDTDDSALDGQSMEITPQYLTMATAVDRRNAGQALRAGIIQIATDEIGVREATGYNDGVKVEEYLAYTGLGKGHAWCAAFVSWCYGKAGLPVPRNAWSPALFPMARRYTGQQVREGRVRPADLFAIFNLRLGRIDHVGLVGKIEGNWLLTVEGNVDNRVLCKRRHLATIHAFSNWLN